MIWEDSFDQGLQLPAGDAKPAVAVCVLGCWRAGWEILGIFVILVILHFKKK